MTRFGPASVIVLFIVGSSAIASGQDAAKDQSTLTINLTDSRGLKLPQGALSIRSSNGRTVYAAEAKDQAVVRLPYGRYSITFEANWYRPAHRDVVIDKPECFVELAAIFVPEEGNTPSSISIQVDPATSCTSGGSLWAKLVSVYSPDTMERRIGVAGFALFEPVEAGVYAVIVVDGSKVRNVSPVVTVSQVTKTTLKLSPCESETR